MTEEFEGFTGTHIDDWVDNPRNDDYARWMFLHFRLPAIHQILARKFIKSRLFCTYARKRYRVTGASRLGDVWLTSSFHRSQGYEMRVAVDSCSEWGPEP
jgi:hypothetical protein